MTEQEKAMVAEIEARCDAVQGLWGSVGNLAGFAERARVDIPWLLSLINRLSHEPEVVRCRDCIHAKPIPAARRRDYFDPDGLRHCALMRTEADVYGVCALQEDCYCDEGERKEGEHG